MKASEFVKLKYPQARAVKQQLPINNGYIVCYTIIAHINGCYILGQGKTESAAWSDAKRNISNIS